jgi:hypothetical protein
LLIKYKQCAAWQIDEQHLHGNLVANGNTAVVNLRRRYQSFLPPVVSTARKHTATGLEGPVLQAEGRNRMLTMLILFGIIYAYMVCALFCAVKFDLPIHTGDD